MTRPKTLVIGGGLSSERKISLLSARSVYESLKEQDFDVEFYDWDGTTEWLSQNLDSFGAVIPILHGKGGEDGEIQRVLESHNSMFLGSSSEVSALCFDKEKTLKKLREIGVSTPTGHTVNFQQYVDHVLFKKPHVLKPFNGGSSIDTFIIDDIKNLNLNQIKDSFTKYGDMLLEEYIDGIEITVPILDGKALSIIEIQPPKNGVFDYDNKYNGKSIELCPPSNLDPVKQIDAKNLGEMINEKLGCRHLSRVDIIFASNKFYVLEVNTMPGLTSQSLYPKAAIADGMSFNDLVLKFVELTLRRD